MRIKAGKFYSGPSQTSGSNDIPPKKGLSVFRIVRPIVSSNVLNLTGESAAKIVPQFKPKSSFAGGALSILKLYLLLFRPDSANNYKYI